jgi:hypothetical protein
MAPTANHSPGLGWTVCIRSGAATGECMGDSLTQELRLQILSMSSTCQDRGSQRIIWSRAKAVVLGPGGGSLGECLGREYER